MISRRQFIRKSSVTGLAFGIFPAAGLFANKNGNGEFVYQSDYFKLQAHSEKPELSYFSADSLGQAQFKVNPLSQRQTAGSDISYRSKVKKHKISWYPGNGRMPDTDQIASWELECNSKQIILRTGWKEGQPVEAFPLSIAQKLNHATVLGAMEGMNQLRFPAVLHMPGLGTFSIVCSVAGIPLFYDAARHFPKGEKGEPFVKTSFAGASANHPEIIYTLEVITIAPRLGVMKGDPRFDGVRRNYINIFQLNPRLQVLANNSASDPCTFTLFLYAEMARRTPQLVKGLSAADLIRNSLDRYLGGMKGYGQVGYNPPSGWLSDFDSLDSMPSLLISACYYVLDTKDLKWATKNYSGVRAWAERMIATDKNNDGIIEYAYSGNSNSWNDKQFRRPANWWDTIGFGHDDAYSNILAYRAYALLAELAGKMDNHADESFFTAAANKLKENFYRNFYNPATGLIAGWKSEDGILHDYYFTFVNSMAVCYGLLDDSQSRSVMNKLLTKMKEVGYTDFRLGLPGNLIPVRSEDYVAHTKRWGWGQKEDGSDGFQIYENGGATGCYAYFTIKALYLLGMRSEADRIFYPMLESYKNGDFEGSCPGTEMTKDWKTWNGECWGYEGFLVDNYLPLLAVHDL